MNLVKSISSQIDSLNRRVIKFFRYGINDVQTAIESGPYGFDSNAVKDMVAVYAETNEKGRPVIIGWLNKNQLAEKGELRIYSTDAAGELKSYIWLKNDGTMLMGGDADNAIRYSPLHSAMEQLAADIQAELVKIASGLSGVGGVYTPGTINIDISAAKIDEIKTL